MEKPKFKAYLHRGKGKFETNRSAFKAIMKIGKHKFILTCFGELSDKLQKEWFDSIIEVLDGFQVKG